VNKHDFLQQLRAVRAEWDHLLAEIPEARLAAPGAAGTWSAKDVIAHVTWGEREMLGLIRQRALAGSDLWQFSTAERNAAIYAQNRDRPLREVLAEARAVYPELLAAFESLDDADFTDPARYAGMPPDWQPWDIFAQNTFTHYRDHLPDLRAARERAGAR
jgi:uncharacterized protein (TIGR03083 family)